MTLTGSEGNMNECKDSQRVEAPGFLSEEQGLGFHLLILRVVYSERMMSWGIGRRGRFQLRQVVEGNAQGSGSRSERCVITEYDFRGLDGRVWKERKTCQEEKVLRMEDRRDLYFGPRRGKQGHKARKTQSSLSPKAEVF